jgi:hypothetical protein
MAVSGGPDLETNRITLPCGPLSDQTRIDLPHKAFPADALPKIAEDCAELLNMV